jgi:hypothetical protein
MGYSFFSLPSFTSCGVLHPSSSSSSSSPTTALTPLNSIPNVLLLELLEDLTQGAIRSAGFFPLASTALISPEASIKSLTTSTEDHEPPAAAQ